MTWLEKQEMGEGASKPCRAILRIFKREMPQMDLDFNTTSICY